MLRVPQHYYLTRAKHCPAPINPALLLQRSSTDLPPAVYCLVLIVLKYCYHTESINTEIAGLGVTEGHVPTKTQLLLCIGQQVLTCANHQYSTAPVKQPPSAI